MPTPASALILSGKRVQTAAGTGSVTRTAARRLISKAAKDMNDYAAKLSQEVPLLRDLLQSGLSSLSKAISLWPDFVHEGNRDHASEWIPAIQGLRGVLSTVEGHIQGFLDSVNGLPRLSADLNMAKRSVSRELESLVKLFQSQQQMLTQTEEAATSLLRKYEGT